MHISRGCWQKSKCLTSKLGGVILRIRYSSTWLPNNKRCAFYEALILFDGKYPLNIIQPFCRLYLILMENIYIVCQYRNYILVGMLNFCKFCWQRRKALHRGCFPGKKLSMPAEFCPSWLLLSWVD